MAPHWHCHPPPPLRPLGAGEGAAPLHGTAGAGGGADAARLMGTAEAAAAAAVMRGVMVRPCICAQEKFGESGLNSGPGGLGPCSTVLQEAKCYMGLKEQNISALTPRHSQQVGQLLRQLQASDGARLTSLQGTSLSTAGIDYVGLLREIADEQSFEVTYVPIDELSPDGKHQCLVQLTSLPLAVCFGTADTPEQAQVAAARCALQYLKIMTKK
ncbi:interferon-inducible double-stranded RNA-dependent protein kinase activator A-like [Rhipicephalus sanguineus]|uniref:interferon-inducible double-stranded RNA-dependent protein kinase activator A-like n=1 Tax=Rhipicephalus sanguineus TaxID=34632 RepID=UPI0018955E42|nr:interferon-inducible double-stranded RNA-dependent protein kinase activator A-like [Rhipicephalus sanguineus]